MKKISQSTDETGHHRNDKVSITGLIIAAGFSSRMGDFKPLLIYKNKSLLINIIEKLNTVCDEIVVVTGYKATQIESELSSLQNRIEIKPIFNENYKDGMFSSLQKGVDHSSNKDWILYHFVDQPGIEESFYKQMVLEIDSRYDWIQPLKNGKKGHPIILGNEVINTILSSPLNSNLKLISEKNNFKKKHFESKTESIFFDVDTKNDYQTLIEQKE
jgi:molybdenum cofactor cytidylyltransferase